MFERKHYATRPDMMECVSSEELCDLVRGHILAVGGGRFAR